MWQKLSRRPSINLGMGLVATIDEFGLSYTDDEESLLRRAMQDILPRPSWMGSKPRATSYPAMATIDELAVANRYQLGFQVFVGPAKVIAKGDGRYILIFRSNGGRRDASGEFVSMGVCGNQLIWLQRWETPKGYIFAGKCETADNKLSVEMINLDGSSITKLYPLEPDSRWLEPNKKSHKSE